MLPDYGRYYGSVFTYLVDRCGAATTLERMNESPQGFYLLNGKLPLYIKFSRSRKGPWSFNFHRDHQTFYQQAVKLYGECIVALVCGADGIAALSNAQLREVLDENFDEQENISVRRKLNRMYSIAGADGKLGQKVARDSLLDLLGFQTTDSEDNLVAAQ